MNKPNKSSLRQQVLALAVGEYLDKVYSESTENTLRNYASSMSATTGRRYAVARSGVVSLRIIRVA